MISWLVIMIMQSESMNLYINECNHNKSDSRYVM